MDKKTSVIQLNIRSMHNQKTTTQIKGKAQKTNSQKNNQHTDAQKNKNILTPQPREDRFKSCQRE
jgi:hypothetical protein